jgi:hypothetical protein
MPLRTFAIRLANEVDGEAVVVTVTTGAADFDPQAAATVATATQRQATVAERQTFISVDF